MNWNEDKIVITQGYFELINYNNIELISIIYQNKDELNRIIPLIEFVISRLETVSTLTIDDRLWDAEIILRSALETFIKFLFIIKSEKTKQDQLLDEYWNSLSEINSLKQSEQAKKNLQYFGNSEIHKLAYSPLILPDILEAELRAKWPRKIRQQIEQKWSFSEMIKSISESHSNTPFEMILTLTHSYRMSSHVMHGDETGILIIKERKERSEVEKNKANRGHYIRLLSDCLTYCAFMGMEISKHLNLKEKIKFFFENHSCADKLQDIILKYKDKVFDDPDYDKYR